MKLATSRLPGLIVFLFAGMCVTIAAHGEDQPTNSLPAISDDQSWIHAGAYGCPDVGPPAFDRVTREGVLFTRAFCSAPSCTPSHAALWTGQDFWRLEQGPT